MDTLSEKSITALKEMCKSRMIKGYSKWSKVQLIDKLKSIDYDQTSRETSISHLYIPLDIIMEVARYCDSSTLGRLLRTSVQSISVWIMNINFDIESTITMTFVRENYSIDIIIHTSDAVFCISDNSHTYHIRTLGSRIYSRPF